MSSAATNTRRSSARLSAKETALPSSSSRPTPHVKQPQAKKQKVSDSKVAARSNNVKHAVVQDTTNYKRVRGRRGQLKTMTEIPFDLLLEIFARVEPIDLLHLSWATKTLREMIEKNGSFLWKSVYANCPEPRPPPIPDDANPFHWTNYLFGKLCQFCGGPRGKLVHDTARIRFCKSCLNTNKMTKPRYTIEISPDIICDGWTHVTGLTGISDMSTAAGNYIVTAHYNQVEREFEEAKAKGEDAITAYKNLRATERHQRVTIAQKVYNWRNECRNYESRIRRELVQERKILIEKKAVEAGYKDEWPRWWVDGLPHVNDLIKLDDNEWNRIKADILDHLQNEREKRQESDIRRVFNERIDGLKAFIGTFEPPHIFPAIINIANQGNVAAVIRDTPFSEIIDRKHFEPFRPVEDDIRRAVNEWREDVDDYLVSLVPRSTSNRTGKGKGKQTLDVGALQLATTFFKCHFCTDPLTYPRVLVHSCLVHKTSPETLEDEDGKKGPEENGEEEEEEGEEEGKIGTHREPRAPLHITTETSWPKLSQWHARGVVAGNKYITFDEEASAFARCIVEGYGKDAATTTQEEMNKLNECARIMCVRCSSAGRKRLVMTWKYAMLHDIQEHLDERPNKKNWSLISDEDVARAMEVEARSGSRWAKPVLTCKLCGQGGFNTKGTTDHLIYFHTSISAGDAYDVEDYFSPSLDSPMKVAPYAVKI